MYNDKKIMITGGTGSWAYELTKQLLDKYVPEQITIFSRGELAQVQMQRKYPSLKYIIGDVRDFNAVNNAMKGIDFVFHLAALKHVPLCEIHSWESVQTNIYGVENVIRAAIINNVKKVIDVSSDKACNPYNMYGACKSVGEKLIIQANNRQNNSNTKFICVRAGNVMGTNGSVIPLFKNLAKDNQDLFVTDKRMTRYFMKIEEAIELLFKASIKGVGGEIFVTKMPSFNILDLAKAIIIETKSKSTIKDMGIRPGEKIHEMLVSQNESFNTYEDNKFRIILPLDGSLDKYYLKYNKMKEDFYSSNQNVLSIQKLIKLLKEGGFL